MKPTVRDRWLQQVWTTTLVPDSVRIVLLLMGQHMTADGYVSTPRAQLADELKRSPRRITERIQLARDAGLLDVVVVGRPGMTAVYAAKIRADGWCARPHLSHGAESSTPGGAPVRTSQPRLHGAPGGPPSSKGSASVSELLAVDQDRERRDDHDETRASLDRDDKGGSNEKEAGTRLPVDAPFARWEPTRPIGPIVVHGAGSSVMRDAAAA